MKTFQIHPRLSFKKIGSEVLILDTKVHRMIHQLNESGTYLWEACLEPATEEHLISILLNQFEVDIETATNDVREFIRELENKDMLSFGEPLA